MRVFSDFKLQHERLCGIRGLLSLVQLLWRRVDNFVGLCSSFRSCPLISPVKRKKTKKVRLRGGGSSTPWMTDSIFGELEREREREIGGGGSHVIYTNNTSGHV